MEPLSIALIGCGRIAQVAHLPALEKASGVRLVAVCDPGEEVARHLPVAHRSQAEVLDDPAVEAVLVAAPDRFHHPIAAAALAAGKHVLVEKPLATTSAEAADLVTMVERTGLVLQVGAMKRHDPGLAYARSFVTERLGRPRSFTAWYRIGDLRPGIEDTLFPPVFADPSAGAAETAIKADRERYLLATHGAHIFDTVRFLLGDVAVVSATHRADGRDHAWQILLTMASGAIGTVAITVDVPGLPSEGIEIFGSEGSLRADIPFPFYRLATQVRAYAAGSTVTPVLTGGDAYRRQLEAFARTIREGGRPDPDVHDGLAAIRLIEAVTAGTEVRL